MKITLKRSSIVRQQAAADYSAHERGKMAARTSAETRIARMRAAMRDKRPTNWQEFESATGQRVQSFFTDQEYSPVLVGEFFEWYIESAIRTWDKPLEIPPTPEPKKLVHVEVQQTDDGYEPRPQQKKAIDMIVNSLFDAKTTNAVAVTTKTGSGKTIIAALIAKYTQDRKYFGRQGFFPFGRVLISAPKSMLIQWRRALIRAGAKGLDREVFILSHDAFRSQDWQMCFGEQEVTRFSNKKMIKQWRAGDPPDLIIIDEYHKFKKESSSRYQYMEAFLEFEATKWIMMSATFAVTLNDTMLFTLASRVKYNGAPVTREDFPAFVHKFCRHMGPGANCDANMERWREYMNFAICDPPNDPMKFKAFNQFKLFSWKTEEEATRYRGLEKAWWDAMKRCGEEPSERGAAMAKFQVFRHGAELLGVPYWGEFMLESYNNGFAPVAALCYQGPVVDLTMWLEEHGVNRKNISIIWGGAKEIKQSEIFTPEEFTPILIKEMEIYEGKLQTDYFDKKTWTKIRKTKEYQKDRMRRWETEDEKAVRMAKMTKLGLHAQTATERQDAVDDFLQGKTQFCIYTFSAGGVGLSLDHQIARARPREVFATTCYYAEEFVQALGRCLRVVTLSNVKQHIMVPRNTIVEHHVIPKLQPKLSSLSKIGSSGLDMLALLEKAAIKNETPEICLEPEKIIETDETVDEIELLGDEEENGDDE